MTTPTWSVNSMYLCPLGRQGGLGFLMAALSQRRHSTEGDPCPPHCYWTWRNAVVGSACPSMEKVAVGSWDRTGKDWDRILYLFSGEVNVSQVK